jgi:hypothetical protein
VSLTLEHPYTLLNTVLGLFGIACALDFEFQDQLDVNMNLTILLCLCSDSGVVRDLALQIAAQYRGLSLSHPINRLLEDCADFIEQKSKRMALMSVSE